jgi:antitoxin ParD1/3/4
MPTRNVNLTKELDQFVASRVESGHYANASEVMRTALRLLERDEQGVRAEDGSAAGGDSRGVEQLARRRWCL